MKSIVSFIPPLRQYATNSLGGICISPFHYVTSLAIFQILVHFASLQFVWSSLYIIYYFPLP